MSIRYFRNEGGGVQQVGNLTEEGAAVLLDAGHEEISAEEYEAAVTAAEEATQAARSLGAPQASSEQPKEASRGRNGRERRR
ncbi:hypothetical protein RKD35_002824 [Streptomyces albogriseolus]